MRSPTAEFDLRVALIKEAQTAQLQLREAPPTPEAIHKCRVSLKRARALARVGREGAPGLAQVFNESARYVMHALSEARDLAVLAQTARLYAENASRRKAKALETVAANLDAARQSLAPPRWDQVRAGLRDLVALAQVWPAASQRQVAKGAERVIKRARAAAREGRAENAAPARHAWRKREKDRAYAAELVGPAWPHDRPRRRKRSLALGHALGLERDVLLLLDRIEKAPTLAGGEDDAARARKTLKEARAKLRRRADRLGERLHQGRA